MSFAAGPFVTVNCAAIPTELTERELFGDGKGGFTGAAALRRGKFELAARERIRQVLDQTDWNVSAAARLLQTERTALHKRIRALGLKRG